MTAGFQEKRLHPRRAHRTRVVFEDEFGEGLFYVYSQDVSIGGLFLASDIPVRLGTMMFLSFTLPGHKRPVRVTGEAVRVVDQDSGRPTGMGIRFVGLTALAKRRLEGFLS